MSPLLPVRRFIGLAWQRYTQHLGRFLEVSLWLLLPALLQIVVLFILTLPSVPIELGTAWTLNLVVARLLTIVIWSWVSIRLVKLALAHDPKEEGYIATHPRIGWDLFFPALWVNILFGLAVAGGTVAFVLPGIWLAVSLSFRLFVLVDSGARGLNALYGSFALVRKRWWPVLGRMVVAFISFFALSFLLFMILSLALDALFGSSLGSDIARLSRSLAIDNVLTTQTLRAFAVTQLQSALLASFTTPFLAIAQGILYKSLKEGLEESM